MNEGRRHITLSFPVSTFSINMQCTPVIGLPTKSGLSIEDRITNVVDGFYHLDIRLDATQNCIVVNESLTVEDSSLNTG